MIHLTFFLIYNLNLGNLFGGLLFQNKTNTHHSGHNKKTDADLSDVDAKI